MSFLRRYRLESREPRRIIGPGRTSVKDQLAKQRIPSALPDTRDILCVQEQADASEPAFAQEPHDDVGLTHLAERIVLEPLLSRVIHLDAQPSHVFGFHHAYQARAVTRRQGDGNARPRIRFSGIHERVRARQRVRRAPEGAQQFHADVRRVVHRIREDVRRGAIDVDGMLDARCEKRCGQRCRADPAGNVHRCVAPAFGHQRIGHREPREPGRLGFFGQNRSPEEPGAGRQPCRPADLRDLLAEQKREADRLKAEGTICPWVFHRHGTAIRDFRGAWEAACIAAGCPGRIPHDFRRTAVRNLTQCVIPDRVAMRITGHKTRAVFDRYRIVSDGDLARAANTLSVAQR
jgi:hypothetical protein